MKSFFAQANKSGIWKYSQGALTNVAHTAESSRPYFDGGIFTTLPNAAGDTLIRYQSASTNEGLYVVGPSGGRVIAFEGDQAPGIDGGAYFATVSGSAFGPSGGIVVYSILLGADTQFGNRESIWVDRGGMLQLVARQGVPHPALPAGLTFSSLESGVIDAANRVFFEAELSDGRESIWIDDGGTLSNIATAGQQPPGINTPGVTYGGFFRPATNVAGTLAYWSLLSGPGLSATNDEAIWSGAPGDLQLVIREGTPVNGVGGPLTFTNIEPGQINAAANIVFYGTAQETYGGTGLWVADGADFQKVAQVGATPPGLVGDIQFSSFTKAVINSLGYVAFEGFLTGDELSLQPSGEGYLDDRGIWVWASDQLLQVVQKGDEIEVREGDVRRITSIDYFTFSGTSGNSDGRASPVSDQGDISFRLRFDDGSHGVFVASVSILDGDYNGDGMVDAADYVLWRKGGPLANEVDNPGTVNALDYDEWRARFGNSGSGAGRGSAGALPSGVPEPGGMFLAAAPLFIGLIMLHRRRGDLADLAYRPSTPQRRGET